MKKYLILFLLSLALLSCRKKDIYINDFTFYVDGLRYDFSRIDEKRMSTNEICVNGYRYSETLPLDSIRYFFMGYNSTSMIGDYGGEIMDRSIQKQTVFDIAPYYSTVNDWWMNYFWIKIDKKVYDAISGYIEIINVNVDKECVNEAAKSSHKMHGTFDFVMVTGTMNRILFM